MSVAREYIYEDLQSYGWTKKGEPEAYQRYEEQHDVPHVKKFPVTEFVSESSIIISDKPVVLVVTYEDDQYFATNESLNIFSVGDSISSVVKDFSQHVQHFFEYYTNKEDEELSGNALRLKGIYNNFQKIK